MTSVHPGLQPSRAARLQASVVGRLRALRAHPLLNPMALAEGWCEWLWGHPGDPEHEPHLVAAIEWLGRAPDPTPDGGVSRALRPPDRRWPPPFPRATGYTHPPPHAPAP